MRLSILIPTVLSRTKSFLPRIISQIEKQYDELSDADRDRVEVISILDNKKIMLGDKRNMMIDIARGDYVVQIDDDDRIATDYIKQLLSATESGADVITFKAEVTINGVVQKFVFTQKTLKKTITRRLTIGYQIIFAVSRET
jgi:glycosyltransferase involved in cell wall biosynthesis